MRRMLWAVLLMLLLALPAFAAEDADFGASAVAGSLPEEAQSALSGWDTMDVSDFGSAAGKLVTGALKTSGGALKGFFGICLSVFGVVLLSAVLRNLGQGETMGAMELAGVLAISLMLYGQFSGFFTDMTRTVDEMTVFASALFPALASATAATGALGASGALLGVTTAVCGALSRLAQLIFLPAISCYMALITADAALGDGSLSMLGDLLRQLMTTALKALVIGVTAYLSLTGVISGSADSSAIRAAKLAISTAVPVVGSMIADASETLLVSAGMVRGSLGILGVLGVLAVSVGPFLKTGLGYLMLKATAAATAATGEKKLSGLISSLAGALGLVTAVTGVCTLLIIVGCVCFLRGTGV